MATLAELTRQHTSLSRDETAHLQHLVSEWGMLADLCFLIYLTDNNNQLQIASGYDLIREENLEGGSLSKSIIPMLTNALQRGRPLRLPASSTSAPSGGPTIMSRRARC